MYKQILTAGIILTVLSSFFFTSCSPINFMTRIKRTPGEYSVNYCEPNIKAPKSFENRKLWIVFSDRENNITLKNPGGKVQFKTLEFLEPLVVIGERGDYLRVAKYDAGNIDKDLLRRKFKDRKKAEYCGWINKGNLLLTRQSVTDIASGFKNKQVALISDTIPTDDPGVFFTKDSIKLFSDVNLTAEVGKMPLHGIIYTLKRSADRKKALIAKKTVITPDSVRHEVLGWVHTSLVGDIGQRLHVETYNIPEDYFLFMDKAKNDTLTIPTYTYFESDNISATYDNLRYSPVKAWSKQDSSIHIKTNLSIPVLDQRDNFVFNVNGEKISYNKFRQLEGDLKNINLMFVFEGRKQLLENYSALVNIVQNLQSSIEGNKEDFNFSFGSVLSVQGKDSGSGVLLKKQEFTSDYNQLIDHLICESENIGRYGPLSVTQTWSGVREAVNMIEQRKEDTNLMIILGESGYSEAVDTFLLNRIADANCRILGFQLHGKVDNESNNFVLQIESMINHYAAKKIKTKRDVIVYADQLRKQNRYKESSKNTYKLDFPDRSMTQGWIVFPEKNESMPLEILINSIDSIITEIKWDNNKLISSIDSAFVAVGYHRFKYDSLFIGYFNPINKFDKKLPSYFTESPVWNLPTYEVTIPDSLETSLNYHLLLSKKELEGLSLFYDALCANEVDYKYKGKKKKSRKICNCPDDEIMKEPEVDDSGEPEYMSTRSIRRKLRALYFYELRNNKLCKPKKRILKKMTLAEAQKNIFGIPTYSPILEKYTLNDIRKKKKLSDAELDELIIYIKSRKANFYEYLQNKNMHKSNGETYYWIDQKLLP